MSKMPSRVSAETQFSKKLKHTSQKCISWVCCSSNTSSFMESSALTQPLVCNKGNPRDPALAIHDVTSKVKSNPDVRYLDDACIGGDQRTVLSSAVTGRNGLSTTGLAINNSKCELNHTTTNERRQTIDLFHEQFPFLLIPDPKQWLLLGSHLHQESAPLHLQAKLYRLTT